MFSDFFNIRYLLFLELVFLLIFILAGFKIFFISLLLLTLFGLIYSFFVSPFLTLLILMYSIFFGSIGETNLLGKAPSVLIVDIIFSLVLLIYIFRFFQNLDLGFQINKYIILCILFLGWSFLMGILSINPARSLVLWKNYFAGFFVLMLTLEALKKHIHIKSVIIALILWGAVLSIIEINILLELGGFSSGIIGLFFKKNLLATSWGRSNYFATFFVIIIPVAIGYLIYSKDFISKLFISLSLLLMASGIVITLSRGGFLALAIAIMILLARTVKRKTFVPLIGIFLIILAAVLLNPLTYVIIDRTASLESSASYFSRVHFYEDVWKTFLTYPLTGVGFGNLGDYSLFRLPTVSSAHNIILGMLGEIGIFGAIVFFLLLGLLFIKAYEKYSNETDPGLRILRWSFIASFIGGFIHSLMEPNFEGIQFSIIFWAMVGIYFRLNLLEKREFN